MRVLVTGGAGYIGSHTVKTLLTEGHNVNIMDLTRDPNFNGTVNAVYSTINLANRPSEEGEPSGKITLNGIGPNGNRIRLHDGNVGNPKDLNDIIDFERKIDNESIDAAIDFAALIEAGISQQEPEKFVDNNVVNFYNFVKSAYSMGIERIIKSSTAATFGNMDPGNGFTELDVLRFKDLNRKGKYESQLDPATTQVGKLSGEKLHQYLLDFTSKRLSSDEDFAEFWKYVQSNDSQTRLRNTVNVYGWTKVMNELTLEHFAKKFGKDHVILRYFNAWGNDRLRENHNPETHLIPIIFDTVKSYEAREDKGSTILDRKDGKKEFMYAFGTDFNTPDGTCIRDYAHVVDLANWHVKALTAPSGVYNLGTGNGNSVKDVINKSLSAIGYEALFLAKSDEESNGGSKYRALSYDNEGKPNSIEILDKTLMGDKILPILEWDRRTGDPPKLFADPTKANDILGYSAKYTIDQPAQLKMVNATR